MIIPDEGYAPLVATPKPASKARRGFAAMDATQRSDLAKRGGKAAHAAGTAHEWTRESAIEAGRKGGLQSSADKARMSAIGKKGGAARTAALRAKKEHIADTRDKL